MILTRSEFKQYWDNLDPRLTVDDGPLWIPDEDTPSKWFVCVKPIGVHKFKWNYYDWCNHALTGRVRCYSSSDDNEQEWWGFTEQQDIAFWLLKWSQ